MNNLDIQILTSVTYILRATLGEMHSSKANIIVASATNILYDYFSNMHSDEYSEIEEIVDLLIKSIQSEQNKISDSDADSLVFQAIQKIEKLI